MERPCLSDIVISGKEEELPHLYNTYAKSAIITEGLHGEGWFRFNNQQRYIVIDTAPIRGSGGELIAVVETLQDITERKQAEMLLSKYRLLSEQARDIILFVRLDGAIIEANNAAIEAYGYERDELATLNIKDLWAGNAGTFDENYMLKLKEQDALFEMVHRRKDGSTFPVEVNSQGTVINNEHVIINIIRDISDRKKSEEALEEQREFSDSLIQNSTVPTFVLDSEHKVIAWNRACELMTGIKAEEVIGTDEHWKAFYQDKRPCIADLVLDEATDELSKYYSKYAKSEIVAEGMSSEGWYENLGGRRRYIIFDAAPIRNSKGEIIAAIEMLQDITKRKISEETLEKQNSRIQKELQLASAIQSSLFPIGMPHVQGVSISAMAATAKEVGGDYGDLLVTGDNKLGIAIGDVMGKGAAAAMFVAMLYAYVRNYVRDINQPGELLNRVNRDLYPQLDFTQQFITFFYGIYDSETREFVYANAGQNPPLLYRAKTGECEFLPIRNFYLGGRREAGFKEGMEKLHQGDIMLFYTDGLKEGMNKDKEQFGTERIIDLVKANSSYDPASIQDIIYTEFNNFLASEELFDDVTMMVLKVD